ncbi:MAG: DUF4271 domain-containing protein [Paludibacter sp.]
MPTLDSIPQLSDSARLALDSIQMRDSIIRDSLARIDSIHRADSIAYVDSVYRHAMSGFQGSISQQVPASQWWVFVLMLLLFGLLVFSVVRTMVSPADVIKGLFDSKKRSVSFNKNSIDSFEQKVYFFIFSSVTVSLTAYVLNYNVTNEFGFREFFFYFMVFNIFAVIKYFISKVLEYVFFGKAVLKKIWEDYLNIFTLLSFLLYLYILLLLFSPFSFDGISIYVVSALVVLAELVFVVVLIRNFLHKIVVSLYLMLYLCTLEILPVLLLIQVFGELANYV